MAILLPALIGLVPLFIAPGILFHYDIVPRVVLLALLMAVALLRPREISEGIAALQARPSGRWLCILAAVYLIWFGIATALSSRPWFSLLGANWRRMGLLTLLSLVMFVVLAAGFMSRQPRAIIIGLRAFAIAAIVASIYGIAQYFDIDPFQPAAAYHAKDGDLTIVRPPGTLGHADYFGWWLAIAVFCAIALERVENGARRWIARVSGVLSGAAILLTGTRSAMLAVAAGLVTLAVLSGIRPRRRHIAVALLGAAALSVFYVSPAGERMRARVQWSADEPLGGARPRLWKDTLSMAAARPLAGFGPETFSAEFPNFQSAQLARLLPDFYYESPHNSALDALADEGIPGLLIAACWIALGWYATRRALPANAAIAGPLAAGLVASGVAAIFGAVTLGPVFGTAAILAMLIAATPEDRAPQPKLRPAAVLAVSVPVALCLAAYAAMLTASELALARFQGSSGSAENAAYMSVARTELPGAGEDLYCSRKLYATCRAIPDPVQAIECSQLAGQAARRATESSDNPPNAWYNLAMFAAAQNDAGTVEKALRQSIVLAPNWFKPHWSLANLMILTGRNSEAHSEAERATQLDGGKDSEVAQTLEKLNSQIR